MITAYNLNRRLAAEGLGSALLLAAIVGSGIMGDRLAGGNTAIALLANMLATSAMLIVLILCFAPISGAHFNPAVTLVMMARKALPWREGAAYAIVQVLGACAGVLLSHIMFAEPLVSFSTRARAGPPQLISEFVATFGLILTILSCALFRPQAVPYAVAAYIGSAYWFTASTSFANPAVTIARSLTSTFSGIRPEDTPAFIIAQILGALAATIFCSWLLANRR